MIPASLSIDLSTAQVAAATPVYGLAATVTMPGIEIGVTGPAGPREVRRTTVVTTALLADGATENGTVTLAAGYRIYSMTADRACRVRLYVDAAHRASDAGRAPGTDPVGDHGCLADFVFTGAGTLNASPMVDCFAAIGIAAPYAIENVSGAPSPVQVGLTWLRTE